ncbi:sidestep protein, putative [Trichonephila clavata]|uniref:Sidestep protein, putative n=1 Tax=Trichonephila clavata TaxID=2740835 RepID=A0A8X6KU64_TRICU|nr:sidestep protein, putative [Trichonephila clavata]
MKMDKVNRKKATILYTAVVRGKVALPCDISPPSADDSVVLILWYKGEDPAPIYTLDARRGTVEQARQSASTHLENRAYFNMINRPAFLQLDPVQEEDAGEYRCRVDFRKARTVNTVITLKVIVPPGEPAILDEEGAQVKGLIGPYNEGDSLLLICEAIGGKIYILYFLS